MKQSTNHMHPRNRPSTGLGPAATLLLVIGLAVPTAVHAQGDPAPVPPTKAAPAANTAAPAAPPAPTPTPPSIDPAPADTSVDAMSLTQILEVAVQQKPSLEQATIDVEIAEAAMLQALGLDDWILDATGSWVSTRQETLNLESNTFALEGNLSRRLSTGGTLRLHADSSYSRGTLNAQDFGIYQHTVSAQLSQPLWRGRGKQITYAERDRARNTRDAAALDRRVQAIAAVREVVSAYWELAYAWRDLEIRKSGLALTQERLRNTQAGIDAGAIAPIEALAVQQSILASEGQILDAEQSISRRSLNLRQLAGLEIGLHDLDMRVSAPASLPEHSFDVDALLVRAMAGSPTLARLQVLERGAKLEVELAENGLLPELDLVVSFGPTGSDGNPGRALINMVSFDDLEMSANLTYRRSLQRRATKGSYAQARARLRKQVIGTKDVEAQITVQLVLAAKRAQTAQKRFELGARAIDLAKQNVEAEKSRFELGGATNFDVLQRQDELQQAQLQQARSLIDFLDALAQLDAITGDILSVYGIALDPALARSE